MEAHLIAAELNAGEHLQQLARGKIDVVWAVGLLVLNAALAVFVLLGFGPCVLTMPLALLVLVTALPVEEFFQAYDDRATLREAVLSRYRPRPGRAILAGQASWIVTDGAVASAAL